MLADSKDSFVANPALRSNNGEQASPTSKPEEMMNRQYKIALAFSFCLSILCLFSRASIAEDLYVDGSVVPSQKNEFQTIAEALEHSVDGDRILIRALDEKSNPIIYLEEDLTIENAIEIRSLESSTGDDHKALVRGSFPIHLDNFDPDDPIHFQNAVAQQATNFPQQKPIFRIANSGVTISHIAVEGSTKVGILVSSLDSNRLSDIAILNCSTFMTFSSGILVSRTDHAVIRNCVVRRACQYGWQECITLNDVHHFEVSNSVVYDRPYLQIPLDIPADKNSEIIKNNGRAIVRGGEGIDAKSGSRHGLIEQNIVASINKFGIYVDGYDKESFDIQIRKNFIYNVGSGIAVASEAGGFTHDILIEGNIVALSRAGLYLNDHGLGKTHSVQNVRIHYNTFFGNHVAGINITNTDLIGVSISNNVSVQNGGSDLRIAESGGYWIYLSNNLIGKAIFDGEEIEPGFIEPNQIVNFANTNKITGNSNPVLKAELTWDPVEWDVPWESRIGSPYLWDGSLYHPLQRSLARDQGNKEFHPSKIDIFGEKRSPRDIGATEYPVQQNSK